MTCQQCIIWTKRALPQKCLKQTPTVNFKSCELQRQYSKRQMQKKSHQVHVFIICGNCKWSTKVSGELWVTIFPPVVCILIVSEEEISILNIFPLSSTLSLTKQDTDSLKSVKKNHKELCHLKSVPFVVTRLKMIDNPKVCVEESSFEFVKKNSDDGLKMLPMSDETFVDLHSVLKNDKIVNNSGNEPKIIETDTHMICDTSNDCHSSDSVVINNNIDCINDSVPAEREKEALNNNLEQCVILPQSELPSLLIETEESNEKEGSIKDVIRRSTTPLEPSPSRPRVVAVAAPAIKPDVEQVDESRDEEKDERSNSSDVVADLIGARRTNSHHVMDNGSLQRHSHSEPSITIDGAQSLQVQGEALSNATSSLPVNSSSQNIGCESAAGTTVVEHCAGSLPSDNFKRYEAILPNPKSKQAPYEESDSQSPEGGTHCTETSEVNQEAEKTNIAHPTTDQIDSSHAEATDAPSKKFEPLEAIIDKLADGDNVLPQISMRYEMLRLFTLHTYPKENKPYIIRLAQAGFYYANNGDEVVCYCCGYRRNMWEETDDPWVIHQRLNPQCKFLLKNEEVNVKISAAGKNGKVSTEKTNVHCVTSHTGSKSQFGSGRINSVNTESSSNGDTSTSAIGDEVSRNASRAHGGFSCLNETNQSSSVNQQQTGSTSVASKASAAADRLSDIRMNRTRVKFPQYANIEKRRATFEGVEGMVVPISTLVESGLFHTGYGDCCRCHVCGIGLRHWSPDDDPWVEHARWSRQCDFVLEKKGQEFIDLVHMAVDISQNGGGESTNNGLTRSQEQRRTIQEPSEIDCLMRCSAAQSLLEMGYSTQLIRLALQAVIDERGRSAINAEVLTEKVFEIEAQRRQVEVTPSRPQETSATLQGDRSQTKIPTVLNDKKSERLEKKRLAKENALLKQQSICSVCKKNSVCIVFLPCGHLVTCDTCAPGVKYCNLPECGKFIKGTVRTYFS